MNILLTSVGRRSYLVRYFKDALDLHDEIHVANSTPISSAFQLADKTVVTPLISDQAYIPFLLNYCQVNAIDAVISLFDNDLCQLALHADDFEKIKVKLIISDIDVINTCHDKYATYRFLCEHNINTPKTYISLDEVYQVIANKEMAFPLIIKPRWGNGSLSIYEADDEEELAFFYKIVKKEIMKSYLVDQSKKDLEHCVIMQEKLIGQEYGLDVINDLTGKYIKTIVKQKIAMRSGETDCAKIISDKRFDYLGEKLSLLLRHMTNLDVDAFIIDGQPYVLELNPRFGGGYPFSHIAGVNLPLAIINWLKKVPISEDLFSVKYNTVALKAIEMMIIEEWNK